MKEYLSLPASYYSALFWIEAMRLPPEAQHHYHVYGLFHYSEKPNTQQLEMALQILVNNNYNLRTTFVMHDEALRQRVRYQQTAKLDLYSVSGDEQFHTLLNQLTHKAFDLKQGPLFRFILIFNQTTQKTTFLPIFHHIILDGTQFDALMEQLSHYYHHPIDLNITDAGELDYLKAYLAVEKEWVKKKSSQFWVDQLNTYPLHINFPHQYCKNHEKSKEVHQLYSLEPGLYMRLKHFGVEHEYSIFQILKTVWAALISIYANQEQLVISFSANMRGKQYPLLKGAFVNTPFYFFERAGTFIDYLATQKKEARLNNHWSVSRVDIISALKEKSHDFSVFFSQSDLFIHGPVLDSNPESAPHQFIGGTSGSKLCFFYQEKAETLHYGLAGLAEWVDKPLFKQMHQHFEVLLSRVLTEPHLSLKTLSCLTKEEHHQLAYAWNKPAIQPQTDQTIHQLFEEQAASAPDRIAIVHEDIKLTYKELNQKANQLAHYLRETYAIQKEDLIAVCLDRSEDLIVAFLAILKSGAAYVPISPKHSDDYIHHMIQDCQTKVSITHAIHQNKMHALLNLLILDAPETRLLLNAQGINNPDSGVENHHLAYVIYTSGTTGKPKGVMIEHRGVTSLTKNASYIQVNVEHTVAQLSDISFDAATFEIYIALLNGAKLVIPQDTLDLLNDSRHFKNYLIENKINVLWLTKTLFDQLYLASEDIFNHIEYLLVGGEALNYSLMAALSASEHKPRHLLNGYGPTECTTFSMIYPITTDKITALQSIPIGKPIEGRTAYILDSNQNLLPIGAIGELYIGGTGLARGYLNQAALTTEKFIANPFKEGTLLYKTGDLVRYLTDGHIEYIGRNDFQVKIRGYRIELGEIENALTRHPGIQQAVAMVHEQSPFHKYLVAYYVADRLLNHDAILETLHPILPDYMLPSALIHLEHFPLTINGKLDRNAFPQPDWRNIAPYVAPKNKTEHEICNLYAELFLLPVDSISTQANFFRLGGNSLLAIQVAHRLSALFDVHIPITEIFQAKTIEQLAQSIETVITTDTAIPVATGLTHYPLSFAQERLLFIEQYEQVTAAYHIPNVIKLTNDIALEALIQAVQSIVDRHQILRTLFIQTETGQSFQCIQSESLHINMRSCRTFDDYQQVIKDDIALPFDLKSEYPIRVCLYEITETKERYLLINIHHIAFDGWSIDILQKELVSYYEYYHLNHALSLPTLPIQYKDFAAWQSRYTSSDAYGKQLDYWRNRLAHYGTLNLTTDKPRPLELSYAARTLSFSFPVELSSQLRGFAQTCGCSLYTILLSGFYVLLNQYTGQTDLILGTPMANRHHLSTQDLMGFFVNMLVQREQLDIHQPITHLIAQIHEHLMEAQRYQDIPFEKLIQEIVKDRDSSRHALFQVTFAVQSFGQKNADFAKYFHSVNTGQPMTACDLGCLIDDSEPTLQGMMLYAERLFKESTLQRWANHYINILTQMITKPAQPLKAYQALSSAEYQQIIYSWNQTDPLHSTDKTIDQLFEEQVERTPNHIAIIYHESSLTYRALNEQVNQLAHYLKKCKPAVETPMGIYMERSPAMIIGILAILKSGGTCVPLDSREPSERLLKIIDDTKLSIVLTDVKLKNQLPHRDLMLISQDNMQIILEETHNLRRNHHTENLAFLVYTSGSTGAPKGVMLPHRVFARCEFWAKDVFCFTPTDRFLFKAIRAPEEFLFPLFLGAPLIIAPPGAERDSSLLVQTIIKNKITVANFTPSFLNVLLDEIDAKQEFYLKHVFCAGELLSVELQNRFFSRLAAYLYNFYGLAEAPYTAYWQCEHPQKTVFIGKPVDANVYILNSERQPVPIGAVGELYIGGPGLARGYLNQSTLTAEKFIANPFQEETRLYKTGDLVRYLADGHIEYIGRNDCQVKIRGFRVELGDIEHQLSQYPGIKQAIILAKQSQQDRSYQYLAAYYVADAPLNEPAILDYLSQHLPEYMIPAILVHMESFPLNTNGKLDRKLLPQPEWKNIDTYVAPRNQTEQQICTLYAELFELPVNHLSIRANFFRLGGNSILAIRLVHRLSQLFNVHLPIAEIFRAKTIEQLAQSIEAISTHNIVIPVAPTLTHYPLSFAQERLWFIEQYEQGTSAYHLPRLVQLSKEITIGALTRALQSIATRHSILRTLFIQTETGQEYQHIQDAPLDIKVQSCKTFAEYQQQLKDDVNRPFNLRYEYPIRVCLYETIEDNARYLLINLHHIASDGWSTDIFQKELIAYYEYYQFNTPLSLPTLSIQYKDFAAWQRAYLGGDELTKQLDYWRTRLDNYEILQLATNNPRTTEVSYNGAHLTFCLSSELSTQLKTLAQTSGCSIYTILLAGFYILLNQYSGQTDIIIGSPIANRHYGSTQDLIGFFVNMLVQREKLNMELSVRHLIGEIHQHLIEAHQHQDIPFEKIIKELNVERDTRRHPLFQILFAVQSFGQQKEKFAAYYQPVDISQLHPVTRFDLEFSIDDSHPGFQGRITYATSLFNESTIQRWAEQYKNLLTQIVNHPDKPLKQYQTMNQIEYQQLIYDWNQTEQAYPADKMIHQLFEAQVERTPHHVAVVYQDMQLTYQTLNEQANQLAHYLRETYAIRGDDLIALCLERSDKMIISILGVLKSGAAYVPIDPHAPEKRIHYILHDTQAKLLINSAFLASKETQQHLIKQPLHNIAPITTSQHLAYVIYTSGTTGNPKGVMIEHRSVNNTLFALQKVYDLKPGEKLAAFTHYAFDVSVSEFFSALWHGAELHLLSDEVRKDTTLISMYLETHAIHCLYLPPVLLALLPQRIYKSLRTIIYAGEACDAATGQYWSSQCKLYNYYGPTETAIYAIGKQVIHGDVHLIGKPIANTTAYILNDDLQPTPMESIGELYIGGVGLARGYLNQSELTAERFIPHPFQKNKHLYKTGDLARYLPDGNIEYIGRNDFQVKIRGFRIEIEEIEHWLCLYPGIKQAVVLANKHPENSQHQYLLGYYVADTALDESAILNNLSYHLPEYMLPNRLIFLDKLPLTNNGKIDKKSLPQTEWKNLNIYIAPQTKTEAQICRIYAELFSLSIENIGTQANFFRLGGNSLLAIQLVHRLSRCFNIHLPVAEIFRTKTISQLAKSIETITTQNIIIPAATELTAYPLSFAQERLWFIEQYEQGTPAYHMPRLTRLHESVSLKALMSALRAIVARHEVLRTVFIQNDKGKEYQYVKSAPPNISIQTCRTWDEFQLQLKEDVNRPFNLRSEYPIRVCLYTIAKSKERYFLLNIHHIASDGWSTDIFQKELVAYYEHYQLDSSLGLSPLSIQYKDFAVWQRAYLAGEEYEKQLHYWRTRLAGYEPLRLAIDKPRPPQLSYAGSSFFFYLTPELSSQLRAFAQEHAYSLYVVLLSGFYLLMHQCSGQKDLVLGTPTANRHYESIKNLIGDFVNVIPQREQLDLEQSIIQLMTQVHQHLIDVQRYQDIPFEKLIQELNVVRDVRFHPLFQVTFSVQSFGIKEKKYAHYFEPVDITDLHPISRFDLAYFVSTSEPAFKGLISYATSLFNESSMQQLLSQYIHILTQMLEMPNKPLKDYQLIPGWTQTAQPSPIKPPPLFTHELEVKYVAPRNERERKICCIYAELFALPMSTISIHADFFQLGGDSILVMQLAAQLSKLFNQPVLISTVFQTKTIEKLAQALEQSAPSLLAKEDFIIPLRTIGSKPPLFIIPGGHGDGFISLNSLVVELKSERPVYAVRSRVLDPHWSVPHTLRDQAIDMFKSIQKIQPHGPYYFFGGCIGGALAVQLQQLAEKQGEPPGIVFLLNSHPLFNKPFYSRPRSTLEKMKAYYTQLKNFYLSKGNPLLKAKYMFKRVFIEIQLDIPKKTEQYYRLLYSGESVRLQSKLHLLLSSDENTQFVFDSWRPFFENTSYLYHLNGNHATSIKESPTIAAILDKILD